MNVLEKILEEIEEATFQEDAPIYIGDMEVDGYVRASRVKEIIRAHMDEAKDTNVHSNDGWIPVEERLPRKGIYVMCCFDDGTVDVLWQNWKEDESLLFYADFENKIRKAVAWQPLPEPYIPPIISKQAQDLKDRESFFMEER